MDDAKGFGTDLKEFQQTLRVKANHEVYTMTKTPKKQREAVDFDELFDTISKEVCPAFKTEESIELLKKYFKVFPKVDKGLLVYGSLGVGKTMFFDIMHAMAKHLVITQGYQKFYFSKCTAPWLVMERMRSIEEGYTGTFDISSFHNGRLYIDDLGAEKLCFNKYELLEEILFQRHRNKALTMVTTNLTPQEIGKRYGERVFDRLGEMFHMIEWQGKSKRE